MDAFSKLVDEGPPKAADILKEDEILQDLDKKKPTVVTGSAKPKKPCANCTCGLADKAPESTPKSSCGSCHLGDAFRCASCPYRGVPAFKPGEKVIIDNIQDDI